MPWTKLFLTESHKLNYTLKKDNFEAGTQTEIFPEFEKFSAHEMELLIQLSQLQVFKFWTIP